MKLNGSTVDTAVCSYWQRLGSTINESPRSRCKHAACIHGNHVYVFGGKDSTQPLKDLWKFDIRTEEWEELDTRGSELGHLQGHSLVSYKRLILIFGGEFTDSQLSAPLWIYNPDLNHIRKCWCDKNSNQPSGRREHSAVIFQNSMYIYGGFIDNKGSTSEFWEYSIDEEEWFLLPSQSGDVPGIRHGHSGVVRGNYLYLYGGMKDLTVKSDLWQYNFNTNKWLQIRSQNGPPALSGHSAIMVCDNMLIFGGENQGKLSSDVWSFHLDSNTWSVLEHNNRVELPPLTQHATVMIHNPCSRETDATIRTLSVPHIQRKKLRSSQYSLPDRPNSTPPGASAVNFQNKIFPSAGSHDAASDFKLQPMRTISVESQYDQNIDERPLLNTSIGSLNVGVDNRGNSISSDELVEVAHFSVDRAQNSSRSRMTVTDKDYYELCSKCLLIFNITKPKIRQNTSLPSQCKSCFQALRRSRHECDILLEDLEQSVEIEPLPNSFYLMHHDKAKQQDSGKGENIELNDIVENCGRPNCDGVISACAKCEHTHVCKSNFPCMPSPIRDFTTIATQTEAVSGEDEKFIRRQNKTNSRSHIYKQEETHTCTTMFSREDIDHGQHSAASTVNNIQVLLIGGKTATSKSLQRSPIAVWKLDIPL